MRVTLVQNEIEEALKQYVESQGIVGNFTEINIIAGRGANGFTAEIDIVKGAPVVLKPANASIPRAIESKEEVANEPTKEESEEAEPSDVPVEGKSLFG